jgi:mannitol/fructose-specific phosphotransferase system IIA component (Ntr-type)
MAIALADLLDPKHVKLALRSRTAENAIRELLELLQANEQVDDAWALAEKIIAREQAQPCVVEEGVVFPHARTDLVDKIVLAIGRTRAGIPFGAPASKANLIFLIGVPQRLVSDYLVCVGALARVVRSGVARAELLKAVTANEFVDILRAASSSDTI